MDKEAAKEIITQQLNDCLQNTSIQKITLDYDSAESEGLAIHIFNCEIELLQYEKDLTFCFPCYIDENKSNYEDDYIRFDALEYGYKYNFWDSLNTENLYIFLFHDLLNKL